MVPLATVLAPGNIAVMSPANATVSGGSIFGIQASRERGRQRQCHDGGGDLITGAAGHQCTKRVASDSVSSSVTVIANGTIHSGTNLTPNGSTPAGISAGYSPNSQNVANGSVAAT